MQEERTTEDHRRSLLRLESEFASARAEREEMMLRVRAGTEPANSGASNRSWWVATALMTVMLFSGGWLMVSKIQASSQAINDPAVVAVPERVEEPAPEPVVDTSAMQEAVEVVEDVVLEEVPPPAEQPPQRRVARRQPRSEQPGAAQPEAASSHMGGADSLADLDGCGNDPLCGGF